VIGGVSAGPAGAVAATVAGLQRWISDSSAARSLAPTSLSGIGLLLGICAAVWFTAGTRAGNLKGALVLGTGYLAVLAARELAARELADPAARRRALAVRSRWLAALATRLSACAVYAGLALGATAQGWTGIWPLAISVLGLNAIRDTMTACGRPARSGWTAEESPPEGLAQRAIWAFLRMPFGGIALVIAVVAPVWGARASLIGLLDWAIIAIGCGIVSTTAALRQDQVRRDNQARDRDRDTVRKLRRHPPRAQAEPGSLAVLLQPLRPPEWSESQAARPNGQSIPVLRMELRRPPPVFRPPAEAGLADAQPSNAGLAGRGPSDGGPADIGLADPGYPDTESPDAAHADTAYADAGYPDTEFPDAAHPDTGYADAGYADAEPADSGFIDSALTGSQRADAGSGAAGSASPGSRQRAERRRDRERGHPAVLRCRDDGAISRWFGRLAHGQLMPLPAALLALAAVATLAHLGLRDLPGLLILAPAIVMLVAAPGSSHPHGGRLDWLVPAVLQGAQYVYIAALGFAAGVPAPLTFALCAAIALRYADLGSAGSPVLVARRRRASGAPARPAPGQPVREQGSWLGWEGRMIACGLGAAMGIAMFAYAVLTAYVAGLVCWKLVTCCLEFREGERR